MTCIYIQNSTLSLIAKYDRKLNTNRFVTHFEGQIFYIIWSLCLYRVYTLELHSQGMSFLDCHKPHSDLPECCVHVEPSHEQGNGGSRFPRTQKIR